MESGRTGLHGALVLYRVAWAISLANDHATILHQRTTEPIVLVKRPSLENAITASAVSDYSLAIINYTYINYTIYNNNKWA